MANEFEDTFEDELDTGNFGVPVGDVPTRDIDSSRASQFPYNAICRLEIILDNGDIDEGTGTLIHPRVLVSAAHCFYYYKNNRITTAKQVTIKPSGGLVNTKQTIVFRTNPQPNVLWSQQWTDIVNRAPNGNKDAKYNGNTTDSNIMKYNGNSRAFDYAFVILDKPFNLTKYFNLKDASDFNREIRVCGVYTDQQRRKIRFFESLSSDSPKFKINNYDSGTLTYNLDTYGGNSGSPVIIKENNNDFSIIGIHSVGNVAGRINSAAKVTPQIINASTAIKSSLK